MIQFNIHDENINHAILWKLAFLRSTVSIKTSTNPTIYVVRVVGYDSTNLIVQIKDNTQFKIPIGSIERVNIAGRVPR
jgi:hypothetical protein